ncbi:MAG: pilus assembly protein PilM [Fusobacteriota bacterium]
MFEEKIEGSIDIGSSSIKALKLKGKKVVAYANETVPNGAILSGNIEDYLAVSDVIKKVVEELELKGKKIVVSLPVQSFFVKFLEIIQTPDEDAKRSLVEHELTDLIPNFDPEEYITEYTYVGDSEEREKQLAITIQKEKIQDLIEILTSLKIVPVKIIPDVVSLHNLISKNKDNIFDEDIQSILVIDIGAEATKIFIENKGVIKMQRVAAVGGNDFTDVIERNKELSYEKAQEYKHNLELEGDEIEDDFEGQDEEITVDIDYEAQEIQTEIQDLVLELEKQIKRSESYFESQEGEVRIESLIITGGGTKLKGLKPEIEKFLMVEAKEIPVTHLFDSEKTDMIEHIRKNSDIFNVVLGNIIDEVN